MEKKEFDEFIKKLKEELCGNDKSFMSNWTRRKIDSLTREIKWNQK